jgi:hypothetical protein
MGRRLSNRAAEPMPSIAAEAGRSLRRMQSGTGQPLRHVTPAVDNRESQLLLFCHRHAIAGR